MREPSEMRRRRQCSNVPLLARHARDDCCVRVLQAVASSLGRLRHDGHAEMRAFLRCNNLGIPSEARGVEDMCADRAHAFHTSPASRLAVAPGGAAPRAWVLGGSARPAQAGPRPASCPRPRRAAPPGARRRFGRHTRKTDIFIHIYSSARREFFSVPTTQCAHRLADPGGSAHVACHVILRICDTATHRLTSAALALLVAFALFHWFGMVGGG